ncbi:MAG: hypothetical protein MAG715_00435 [Methanonatronarchaeales archaeon]|nr:hypothetical protein [Methanonatronarchaeales archaeon]
MGRETVLGVEENVEAVLCYSLGFLTGLLFYLLERDNAFVRFHAAQSIIVFGALYVASLLLSYLSLLTLPVQVVYGVLGSLLSVASLLAWILLMVRAYQGEWYEFPVAGRLAMKRI